MGVRPARKPVNPPAPTSSFSPKQHINWNLINHKLFSELVYWAITTNEVVKSEVSCLCLTPPPPSPVSSYFISLLEPHSSRGDTATMQAREDKAVLRQLGALISGLNPASAGLCLSLLPSPSVFVP